MSNVINTNLVARNSEQQVVAMQTPENESVARMDSEYGASNATDEEQAAISEGVEMFAVNLIMGTMRATSEAVNEIRSIDSSVEPDWMPERADDGEAEA